MQNSILKHLIGMLTVLSTFTAITYVASHPEIMPNSIKTESKVETKPTFKPSYGVFIYNYDRTRIIDKIDWGTIYKPQNSTGYGFYDICIVNTTDKKFNFTIATANWNPPNATIYLSFTYWSETNQVSPHSYIPITLVLEVAENCTGITYFSFDITFAFTEV